MTRESFAGREMAAGAGRSVHHSATVRADWDGTLYIGRELRPDRPKSGSTARPEYAEVGFFQAKNGFRDRQDHPDGVPSIDAAKPPAKWAGEGRRTHAGAFLCTALQLPLAARGRLGHIGPVGDVAEWL